jgi:glycosyltransferase involved in cell wall biosynthesis
MRFLNIILSANPRDGGAIESVRQQAIALKALGHDSDVASMDLPGDPWVQGQPFEVFALGDADGARQRKSPLPWKRYGHAPKLIPWLKDHAAQYDAVLVHGLWNYTAYAAWAALRDAGVPWFVFPHGMMAAWFRQHYPLKHWVKQAYWLVSEGRLLRDADCVLFTSAIEQQEADGAFLGYSFRGRVVPYGISDPPQVDPLPGWAGRDYLLFLSRIHEKKGIDILLNAFAAVAATHPQIDLVIAGPDDEGLASTLRELASALGIADRVHWPGMLAADAKWSALRGAAAMVLASHQENFGVVVAEAMACGVPVLTTDKVALWREIADADAGVTGTDTVESFTGVLREFLALAPEARTAMGRRARTAFLEKLEVTSAAKALVALATEFKRGDAPPKSR